MRRVWIALALVALVGSAAAPGPPDRDPRDPREAFTAGDQAWAKRIALKRSDLPAGWRGVPPSSGDDPRCSSFDPNLSDLTLTGRSESPEFTRAAEVVASVTEIFRTAGEAGADFRRGARRS